jgi:hypothetical protein
MKWLAGALLMTSACTTPAGAGGEEAVPEHGTTAGYRCDDSEAQSLVGQAGTQDLGARALQLTRARTLRWIRPGDAVTMDYRTDRLNIHLDARGRVERISCG